MYFTKCEMSTVDATDSVGAVTVEEERAEKRAPKSGRKLFAKPHHKPMKSSKPEPQFQPKLTFSTVFSSKMYGAAKQAKFPRNLNGIMVFKASATSVDINDATVVKQYSKPKLMHCHVLNADKMRRILEIINEA